MPQKLLTKEHLRKLPKLYTTENHPDPVAVVKFFTPWSSWTWYATEYDGKDTFFGYIDEGQEGYLGYFSLSDFQRFYGKWGLRIQRDFYFKPTPLSKIMPKKGIAR